MKAGRTAGLLLAAAFAAGPLPGHDFWIEPSSFRPAVGAQVQVRLFVGQNLAGDALPRNPASIEKFVLVSPAGERPVPGEPGAEPAGTVRIETPGLQFLAYRSRDSFLSQEAAKFEEYLHEEGLESIIAARTRRGESGKPSRELFSRAAKALLSAEAPAQGYDRNLGLRLELLPEKDPYALKAKATLPVRLLFEGKPLSGALVVALPKDAPAQRFSQRTDARGRVTLRLERAGVWLVKAVHMVQAPEGSGADWQSIWASLTFEIPGGNPVGRTP